MTRRNVFFFFSEKPPIAGIERKKGRKAVLVCTCICRVVGILYWCIFVQVYLRPVAPNILREMVVSAMMFEVRKVAELALDSTKMLPLQASLV